MTQETAVPALREVIAGLMAQFTASERKVANVILADYPYGGLMPIQELARRSHVSAPSITRFVAKIGCGGYQDFQRRLIGALKQRELSPIELKFTEAAPKSVHLLTDHTNRLLRLMTEMTESVPENSFDEVCALIADPSRNIFIIGGRVTDTIAMLLSVHLRQFRPRVFHIPTDPEKWPEYVLRMRKQDVVVLFDMRRYEARLAALAELIARSRQSQVIAITDKWLSPISHHATHVFALPTDSQTPWGSQICLVSLVEAIIVRTSEIDWSATRKRIAQWDQIRFSLASGPIRDDDDDEAHTAGGGQA